MINLLVAGTALVWDKRVIKSIVVEMPDEYSSLDDSKNDFELLRNELREQYKYTDFLHIAKTGTIISISKLD